MLKHLHPRQTSSFFPNKHVFQANTQVVFQTIGLAASLWDLQPPQLYVHHSLSFRLVKSVFQHFSIESGHCLAGQLHFNHIFVCQLKDYNLGQNLRKNNAFKHLGNCSFSYHRSHQIVLVWFLYKWQEKKV